MRLSALASMWLLVALIAVEPLQAAEFEAGVGPTIHGRCHMDFCGLSNIQVSAPVAVLRDGTLFAISGQAWGETYDPNVPGDEYAHASKGVEAKTPYMMMVFCSKTRPHVFWYDVTSKNWQANALKPGDDAAISGADESAYQDYWAACHHLFPQSAFDPLVYKLARELGYHFQGGPPDGDGDDSITQPSDLLR